MDFWNKKTPLGLSQEQIASIAQSQSRYKNPLSVSADVFEKTLSHSSSSPSYYEKSLLFSFFKAKRSYSNTSGDLEFTLEDIQRLILEDKASTLFRKVCRVGDIIPFVQEDHFDLDNVSKVIKLFDADVNIFKVSDVCFVGLLPGIIKFGATHCFDLFIQAYLALHAAFPPIRAVIGFSINDIITLISRSSEERYFIGRFIDLTIKLYPADQVHLYQVIKFACGNNLRHVIYDSLASISPERKSAVINQWSKMDLYSSLLRELYLKEECRYNMKQALNKALEFFENNPDFEIHDLINCQKMVNAPFDSSIDALQSAMNNPDDHVTSNRPRK